MALLASLIARHGGGSSTYTPPAEPVPIANAFIPAVSATIIDDGYDNSPVYNSGPTNYNKWPRGAALSNGAIIVGYGKSHNHASKGFAGLSIWDGTWYNRLITINGVPIHTVEIAVQLIDGRIWIAYQDNPTEYDEATYWPNYDNVKMCYVDEADLIADRDADFVASSTVMFTYDGEEEGWAWVVSPFGRMQKLAGGRLVQLVYGFLQDFGASYPYPVQEAILTYIKSDDDGATWEKAATPIITRTGGTFPNGFISETGIIYIPGYGYAIRARNEEYGFYTAATSPDFETWTVDDDLLFYAFGSASGERRPVHPILLSNGNVRTYCGNRALELDNSTPNYHLEYIESTPEVFWNNTGYAGGDFTPTVVETDYMVQAALNSSGIHWGYTEPIHRYYPDYGIDENIVHGYDSSPLNDEPDEVRTVIFQYVVDDNNTYPDPL